MQAYTARLAGEFTAALHMGPGPHPSGSSQDTHGGQMAFDFEQSAEPAAVAFEDAAAAGRANLVVRNAATSPLKR